MIKGSGMAQIPAVYIALSSEELYTSVIRNLFETVDKTMVFGKKRKGHLKGSRMTQFTDY